MKKNIIIMLAAGLIMIITATTSCKKDTVNTVNNSVVVKLPVLTTTAITAVTQKTAAAGGNITSDGGATISSRGICWSTTNEPTISDNKTVEGTGAGSFTSSLTGLTSAAVYNVRAYATNSLGTAYGNKVTFSAVEIGQLYQGGTIAYILQPGDPGYTEGPAHGIIASSSTTNGLKWFPSTTFATTGAKATALGTGNANTTLIVAIQNTGVYAANACFTEKNGIYDDWYLPSKDEMNKLYLVKNKISSSPPPGYYWTSSEISNTEVWIQSFATGAQSTYDKNGSGFWTWAIRSF